VCVMLGYPALRLVLCQFSHPTRSFNIYPRIICYNGHSDRSWFTFQFMVLPDLPMPASNPSL